VGLRSFSTKPRGIGAFELPGSADAFLETREALEFVVREGLLLSTLAGYSFAVSF